jgi:hypothetical protein
LGIEGVKTSNYIYKMKFWGIVSGFNESSFKRTNDLSCLLFVIFLLVSQLLYVKMIDKKENTTLIKQQHQSQDVHDY